VTDAPPPAVGREAFERRDLIHLLGASAFRGLAVFLAALALGEAIAMAEFVLTNGRYRTWTWVKVGMLYVLSFCGVGIRADLLDPAFAQSGTGVHFVYRVPLLLVTAGLGWLLFLAGRRAGRATPAAGRAAAAVVAVAVGFTMPIAVAAIPAVLRFPDYGATLAPIRWESAVLPFAVALAGAGAGVLLTRRERLDDAWVRWIEGGWRMFVLSLLLVLAGSLVLAALKPAQVEVYVRTLESSGRAGAVIGVHHLLLLPAQAMLSVAPVMGGSVEASIGEDDVTTVSTSEIHLGRLARYLLARVPGKSRIPLGGGFHLFLLVPTVATVLGGRHAAARVSSTAGRAGAGAGAGVVFAVLVTAGVMLATASLPLGPYGVAPVSIRASMPSTAVLALAWGVVGGTVGGLTAAVLRRRADPPPSPR
jgi:hypothetical protein